MTVYTISGITHTGDLQRETASSREEAKERAAFMEHCSMDQVVIGQREATLAEKISALLKSVGFTQKGGDLLRGSLSVVVEGVGASKAAISWADNTPGSHGLRVVTSAQEVFEALEQCGIHCWMSTELSQEVGGGDHHPVVSVWGYDETTFLHDPIAQEWVSRVPELLKPYDARTAAHATRASEWNGTSIGLEDFIVS